MSNRSIIIVIIVVVLIALGILWLVPFSNPNDENTNPQPTENASPEVVRVNHFFKDGVHTVEGTITLPTPCHSLDTTSEVNGNNAVIKFTSTPGSGVCAQVVADKFFSISFQGPENVNITATYNGAPLRLDIIEGTEGGIEKL